MIGIREDAERVLEESNQKWEAKRREDVIAAIKTAFGDEYAERAVFTGVSEFTIDEVRFTYGDTIATWGYPCLWVKPVPEARWMPVRSLESLARAFKDPDVPRPLIQVTPRKRWLPF
jgi:hypothetical protein